MCVCVRVLADKLYYVTLRVQPRPSTSAVFFCIDQDLVYEPFFADFGPLNLGKLYRFCQMLNARLDVRALVHRGPLVSVDALSFLARPSLLQQRKSGMCVSLFDVWWDECSSNGMVCGRMCRIRRTPRSASIFTPATTSTSVPMPPA